MQQIEMSKCGASDLEFRHLQKMLANRNCMFRLRQKDLPVTTGHVIQRGERAGKVDDAMCSSSELPSELASILAEAGVHRSLNDLKNEYNMAREDSDDDASLTAERSGSGTDNLCWSESLHLHQPFDLIERRQIDKDLEILQSAILTPVDAGWCLKIVPDGDQVTSGEQKKKQLLETLRIASRGNFLMGAPPLNTNRATPSILCMPWLDPQHWFTLSAFLVSQFEIALWSEFQQHNSSRAVPELEKTKSNNTQPNASHVSTIIDRLSCLNVEEQERVWRRAIALALLQEFRDTKNLIDAYQHTGTSQNMLLPKSDRFDTVRASLIMRLTLALNPIAPAVGTPNAFIPLLQLGTPQSQLKLLVFSNLEESYSLEIQRTLLEMTDAPKIEKCRRRKKKKKRAKQKAVVDVSNKVIPGLHLCDEQHVEESNSIMHPKGSDDDFDENDLAVESIIHVGQTQQGVTEKASWHPQKVIHHENQEKILVLQIIEDILHGVFETVDIASSCHATETIKASSSASSVADEWAVSTAVVSNRDSFNSALNVLERQDIETTDPYHHPADSVQIALSDADESIFLQLSKDEHSVFDGAPLCLSGALDSYNGVACPQQEQDIIHNLLDPHPHLTDPNSTAASVASSEIDLGLDITSSDGMKLLDGSNNAAHLERFNRNVLTEIKMKSPATSVSPTPESLRETPPPPPTPSPQLSPSLVSLADLGKLRKKATHLDSSPEESSSPVPSLKPSSVISLTDGAALSRNCSRDDLRSIDERRRPHRRERDNNVGRPHLERVKNRNVDALLSYRNVVAQSVHRKHSQDSKQKVSEDVHPLTARNAKVILTPRSSAWLSHESSNPLTTTTCFKEPIINKVLHVDVTYAKSECAPDGAEDASHCNVIPRAQTDDTMTRDGATTISSARSPPVVEQFAQIKEERDSYRDHCLMLGAENAKLRNLLASKTCTPLYQSHLSFLSDQVSHHFYTNPTFQFHFGHPVAAMSDAGIHRGEHESSVRSEDGTETQHPSVIGMNVPQNSLSWQTRGDSVHSIGRRTSIGGTYAESDLSLEQNAGQEPQLLSGIRFFGSMQIYGMQSRLSRGEYRSKHLISIPSDFTYPFTGIFNI